MCLSSISPRNRPASPGLAMRCTHVADAINRYLRADGMDEAQCIALIHQLWGKSIPTAGSTTTSGESARFSKSYAAIEKNRAHYYGEPSVAPPVPPQFEAQIPREVRYQWRGLPAYHQLFRARLSANVGQARAVSDSLTKSAQDIRDRIERVFNAFLRQQEADGLSVLAFAK